MTCRAVSLLGPSEITGGRWLAEDCDARKNYTLPEVAAAMLFYCFEPREQAEVTSQIAQFENFSEAAVGELIGELLEKRLLVRKTDASEEIDIDCKNSQLFFSQYERWHQFNWGSAADYHFFFLRLPIFRLS